MQIWYRIFWYLRYRLRAKGRFRIHSPFVFRLVEEVLPQRQSAVGQKLVGLRRRLAGDQRLISYEDLGAGHANQGPQTRARSLGKLLRQAARSPREGEFLYRLVAFLQPTHCVELGTHLGFSSAYQCAALPPNSRFVTIEGAATLATLAEELWKEIDLQPLPELKVGDFDAVLAQLWSAGFRPSYAFVDGNHRFEPTIRYARQLIGHMGPEAVIVFDDIYWSQEMKRAWEEMITWAEVTVSIDVFYFGILLLNRSQAKEHFVIKGHGWR